MHDSAKRAISRFYHDPKFKSYIDGNLIADMGALNINGAVRDVIPHCTGFDIVEGPGVDVVLKPGEIPPQHQHKYGTVVSANSFVFCPDPDLYKKQIIDLLTDDGLLLLITCSNKCTQKHTTSNNQYGFEDTFRVEIKELERFFSIEFDVLELSELNYEHPDFVLIGRLKHPQ
jgi:hypothetical protein